MTSSSYNGEKVKITRGAQRQDAHIFYSKCGYIETKEQKNFKKMFGSKK